MKIPLLAGETCRMGGGRPTVVVNRSFANTYMKDGTIGRHLQLFPNAPPSEIIGIAGDAREQGINHRAAPTVYSCYEVAQPGAYFLVRTRAAPGAMAETIRRRIHEVEPSRSTFDMMPLAQHLDSEFAENRLRTILLTFFAVTAVSLACMGLYGMLNYLVHVRRREVGLQLALGAARGAILRRFLLQGLGITITGCIAGLMLALASTRLLSGMLYGVPPSDKETLGAVIVLVLGVATLASMIPSIRAARVEPMQVLRDE